MQHDWGYEDENGPAAWGRLNPEYAVCALGECQSPIDVVDPTPARLPRIEFNYRAVALRVLNNGHTVEVPSGGESWITVEGTRYVLQQFHFHTPGEHTLGGRPFDMEIHLVHKSDDGTLAVLGVLVERGREHPGLGLLADRLPAAPGEVHRTEDLKFNAIVLLPAVRQTVRYEGSLTTPPCSEGVQWFLFNTPIEASETQLAAFHAVLGNNSRPVQPTNGREVLVGEDS